MFDLLLDNITHDIVIDDETGELQSTGGAPLVAQKVEIRLSTQLGEWLYDLSMGIDYLGRVLVKSPDTRVIRSLFVAEIFQVSEVTALRSLTLTTSGRDLTVRFEAETTQGAIQGSV